MTENEYRNTARQIQREAWWTLPRVLAILLVTVGVLTAFGFVTRSLGLWGSTVVERAVFENSYQRSEALKSQIAVDEAALAEIGRKLSNPGLTDNTRHNLEAQASAARIRIQTARSKQ